ncbi:MAG TPA: hypothetical protein VLF69_01365 [Candidatus Saccharimonadales bacterium]|nr:hypothetical protein [Candidatus Saccharimonadales bacterium]
MTAVDAILKEMLSATKPSDEALAEAKARRDAVFEAALTYEGAYKTIKSGSIAHGTVSNVERKVTDGDGSVVLSRKVYPDYGPDGKNVGPKELIESIADDMRNLVQQIYPNVWVSTNHKHAIYFRFREPLADGQDPTVDLVVALNRKDAPGLWIPHLGKDEWQPSDPEAHTQLIKAQRDATNRLSTKVIRVGKLYAKQWSPELLYSFHVAALVLESLQNTTSLGEGLLALLGHGAKSLAAGNTKDPAGVSAPLKLPEGRKREKLVKKLERAAEHLERAIGLETTDDENFEAIVSELEKVFWKDDIQAVLATAALKIKIDREQARAAAFTIAVPTTASSISRPTINTRAYGGTPQSASYPDVALPCTWYNDTTSRIWFEQGLASSEYTLLFAGLNNKSQCVYVVSVPVLAYATNVIVRVVLDDRYATVLAPSMSNLRHVYASDLGQALCLWYPHDPPHRKWNFDNGLLALLDIVKLHLYKELRFKETGAWPGEEVHQ